MECIVQMFILTESERPECVDVCACVILTDQGWVFISDDAILDWGLQGQRLDSCIPEGEEKKFRNTNLQCYDIHL